MYLRLVIQPVLIPFINSIQIDVFQKDNTRTHAAVIIQHRIEIVHMFRGIARTVDLSPIEHI